MQQQQPAVPSQEEGVPPAAATAAREAQQGRAVQEEPPVAEQTTSTFESRPASPELGARAAAARRAPRWVPDADAPSCMLCDMVFWRAGPVAWTRHHCRSCGWVVCLACMPKDQVLPLGRWVSSTAGHPLECGAPTKEQRVCNSCVQHS